ncbi:hypothetical protein QYF61_014472, partial [Mycteria americana]
MFYDEGGETLEKVAQRSCECPIIGSVQGQVGWGFEQPDLERDHSMGYKHGHGLSQGTAILQIASFRSALNFLCPCVISNPRYLSWFNPSQQLSTTLSSLTPPRWDGGENQKSKREKTPQLYILSMTSYALHHCVAYRLTAGEEPMESPINRSVRAGVHSVLFPASVNTPSPSNRSFV